MEHVSKNGQDMAEQVQLDITWDGPVSGLAEHRLSLSAFGPALEKLLMAAKRIASNLVTNAGEPSETGRLAKLAHAIDIEVKGVKEGSSGIASLLTFDAPVSYQPTLFGSLPERTGTELLDAIQAESQGQFRNNLVRHFLRALPPGLSKQNYRLYEGNRIIREVQLGQVKLPEGMLDLPYLEEVVGMVTGVGFDPGRDEVRIRTDNATHVTAIAVSEQVENALTLRHEKVRALLLHSEIGSKLLTLEDNDARRPAYSEEKYIFDRWDAAFRVLA
jgi:hypothetical protein